VYDPFSRPDPLLSLGSGQIQGCLWRGAGCSMRNGLLVAYQARLPIAKGLARRDPAKTQWQVQVEVPYLAPSSKT
jgi:hypothetical protein